MKIDVMQEAATILDSLGFLRVRKGSVYRLKGETIDIVVEVMRSRIYFFQFFGAAGCGNEAITRRACHLLNEFKRTADPAHFFELDRPYIHGASFSNFDRDGKHAHGSFDADQAEHFKRFLLQVVIPQLSLIRSLADLYLASVTDEVPPPFGWQYSNHELRYVHAFVIGDAIGVAVKETQSRLDLALQRNTLTVSPELGEFLFRRLADPTASGH